nr:hypothetical protein [Tanacetum cinerariifolium]
MLNHSKAEPMGLLNDTLCQFGVTTIITKFLIMDMPINRDTLILVRRGFLHNCGSILNIIKRITSTVDEIGHQTFHAAKTSLDTAETDSDDAEDFLGSLPVALQHIDWITDYTGCFNKKEDGDGQWHAEIRLTDPYGNIYDQGFLTKKTTRKLAKILPQLCGNPLLTSISVSLLMGMSRMRNFVMMVVTPNWHKAIVLITGLSSSNKDYLLQISMASASLSASSEVNGFPVDNDGPRAE